MRSRTTRPIQPDIRYTYTRTEYEKEFGKGYKRPGIFARLVVFVVRVVPKIGPLSALAFKTPTLEAERLFGESFEAGRERYRAHLEAASQNRLDPANADFDTGEPTSRGEYPLADDTYAELLERLTSKTPMTVPDAMRAEILRFYRTLDVSTARDRKERKQLEKIDKELAILKSNHEEPKNTK